MRAQYCAGFAQMIRPAEPFSFCSIYGDRFADEKLVIYCWPAAGVKLICDNSRPSASSSATPDPATSRWPMLYAERVGTAGPLVLTCRA